MPSDRSTLPADSERALESFLDEWLVEYDVPGASVVVVDEDGVRYAKGHGARHVASKSPATPETIYPLGSVTKTFTAVATLQLVERGSLALDDEIRQYVDVWDDVPGEPITVEELLAHASGMPNDYSWQREPWFYETSPTTDAPSTSPLLTRDDWARHANGISDRRIDDPHGYLYGNPGYDILGEIIETVSPRSHAEHVETEVFEPLGMERSYLEHGELSVEDDVAMGYAIEEGEPVEYDHHLDPSGTYANPPFAAGHMLSSMTDLATFVRCLLNDGRADGDRILGERLVEAMCSHQAPHWSTVDGEKDGYGYGMGLTAFDGETLTGHGGSAAAGHAYAGMFRDRGIGAAVAVNTAGVPIRSLTRGILATVAGMPVEEAVPYVALQEKLSAVTGTYEGYRGGSAVSVERAETEAHLDVSYEEGPFGAFPAFPETLAHDDYRFYRVGSSGRRIPVTFHETDDGMELRYHSDALRRV